MNMFLFYLKKRYVLPTELTPDTSVIPLGVMIRMFGPLLHFPRQFTLLISTKF